MEDGKHHDPRLLNEVPPDHASTDRFHHLFVHEGSLRNPVENFLNVRSEVGAETRTLLLVPVEGLVKLDLGRRSQMTGSLIGGIWLGREP